MFISEGSQWVGKQADRRREHVGKTHPSLRRIYQQKLALKKKDRFKIIVLIFLDPSFEVENSLCFEKN